MKKTPRSQTLQTRSMDTPMASATPGTLQATQRSQQTKGAAGSAKNESPEWISDVLSAIDKAAASPLATMAEASPKTVDTVKKTAATFAFLISALGVAFSVVNVMYLSTLDEYCSGYNKQEKRFLFIVSIILAVFFGILTLLSIYGVNVAFA